jgi:hypothetical protein
MALLRERIDDNPHGVEGTFSQKNGVLCMAEANRRFWSPCLDLTIDDASEDSSEDDEESATPADASQPSGVVTPCEIVKVWGTFSPRPEIWTSFVFAIGTLIILAFLSLMFAIAQLMIGHPPWALLIPLVSLLVAAGIYASALTGQGLSGDDMYKMRAYVDSCLADAQEACERRPQLSPRASSQL